MSSSVDRNALFRRGDLLSDDFLQKFKCLSHDEVFLKGTVSGKPTPPFACKFSVNGLHGNLLVMVDEEGVIRLIDTRKSANESLIKEWNGHNNAVFDFSFAGDNHLVTGSGDTTLVQWDLETGVAIRRFRGHSSSVKSVDIEQSSPRGREGSIFLWDTRRTSKDGPVTGKSDAHLGRDVLKTLRPANRKRTKLVAVTTQVAVTTVLFHREHYIASSGAADGSVKLWDRRKVCSGTLTSCHTFLSGSHGITSLISDPYQTTLYASSIDDRIYVCDSIRLKTCPVGVLSGHQNSTFYVKSAISCSGRFLLSGSSCGSAYIWDTQNPLTPPTLLIGHNLEVTAVAWSPTQLDKIVTCSDACDFRIWRATADTKEQLIGYAERKTNRTISTDTLHLSENTPHNNTPITSTNTSITRAVEKTKRKSTSCLSKCTKQFTKVQKLDQQTMQRQRTITSFYFTPQSC